MNTTGLMVIKRTACIVILSAALPATVLAESGLDALKAIEALKAHLDGLGREMLTNGAASS